MSGIHSVKPETDPTVLKTKKKQHALVPCIVAADHQLVAQQLGTASWAQKDYAVESIRWSVLQRIRKWEF